MQTKARSMLEVICNTGSGVLCALLAWKYIVIPWVQLLDIDLETMSIGLVVAMNGVFTVVSVVRGYAWRRFFNLGD